MKQFILKREIISNKATLGKIYDGDKFICATLENPWLNNLPKVSCIPCGTYIVRRDYTGKFRYWKLYGVPNREFIEIHNGEKERHTWGCILVGSHWDFVDDELAVVNSKKTLQKLLDEKIFPDEFELKII